MSGFIRKSLCRLIAGSYSRSSLRPACALFSIKLTRGPPFRAPPLFFLALLAFLSPLAAHAQSYYFTGRIPSMPEATTTNTTCDGDAIGSIRYNTGNSTFEGCNGTAWADIRSGATATPAGSNTQIQFNSGGILGASANFTWNNSTGTLGVTGSVSVSNSVLFGLTTGLAAPVAIDLSQLGDTSISSPSNGQVLTYNGTYWVNSAAGGGGSGGRLDQITAATAANTIDSTNKPQTWNWSTLSTGTGLSLGANGLTSGSILYVSSNGTLGVNGETGLNIALGGVNATGAQTTYGEQIANTHSGTSTNVGLYATASGGSNNYAAIFNAGNVGVGTTAPGTALDVNGGVTMEPTTVTLTANNTVLATANRSYFQVTSDNTTETNRIFCFGAGTLGQVLVVEWTSSTNRGEIVKGGNCSGATGAVAASVAVTWAPRGAETILQLMYNGTHWVQIAGSANF